MPQNQTPDILLSKFNKLKRLVYEKEGYNLLPCIYEENEHRLLVKELINNYPTEEMLLSIVNKFNLLEKDGKTVFMLGFLESLLLLAPLIKARGFKEEKEWRLITPILNVNNAKFRKGNFSLIPYWEFDVNLMDTLKTIIIGPTPEPELSSEAVQDLFLREHSAIYPIAINIYSSEIPFRRI
jgi:hypothetical protein